MIITEEKILSNIDKVQKMINPNNKKQIIQLEEDAFFKDIIDSIKTYITEYPKKKNFPPQVYKSAYDLVEYSTSQFEENTKQIEELIRQREYNINLSSKLRSALEAAEYKAKDWKDKLKDISSQVSEDIVEALIIVWKAKSNRTENYLDAVKLINARAVNLGSNLHIEIDMERIEDRSKALGYIGIEIAESLKEVSAPPVQAVAQEEIQANDSFIEDTRFEVKMTLWQRIKNSRIIRAITNIGRSKRAAGNLLSDGNYDKDF
jgi:hypothetical protein